MGIIGKVMRFVGVAIWIGTHIFILISGLTPEAVMPHAIINLVGVALYFIGEFV